MPLVISPRLATVLTRLDGSLASLEGHSPPPPTNPPTCILSLLCSPMP